jgi:hypothetical protein
MGGQTDHLGAVHAQVPTVDSKEFTTENTEKMRKQEGLVPLSTSTSPARETAAPA